MTKGEKQAVLTAAKRIRELASMKNARFAMTDEKDQTIKNGVRPYMGWFELVAEKLETLVSAESTYQKKEAIFDLLSETDLD